MKDALGERMKGQYENRSKFFLPRRTYAIIRLDGKAWHTYTRSLDKPFDLDLIRNLDDAVLATMIHIQGARFAYVQSDEISILLTDFDKPETHAWFDNSIQKIVSVSASILTAEFNNRRTNCDLAYFDARIFTIPDPIEVYNYFVWRNQDCARNSINMVAQSLYSHKELQNKSCDEVQEMIFQKGINWSEYPQHLKNGRLIVKDKYETHSFSPWAPSTLIERTRWISVPAPVFTREKQVLLDLIPKYE